MKPRKPGKDLFLSDEQRAQLRATMNVLMAPKQKAQSVTPWAEKGKQNVRVRSQSN